MTSGRLYKYITDKLCESMRSNYSSVRTEYDTESIEGFGASHNKSNAKKEAALRILIDAFVSRGKDRYFLVSSDGGKLYVYNGEYYEPITTNPKMFMCEVLKRAFFALRIGGAYQIRVNAISDSVISSILCSDEFLFSPDRRYICFKNGVFDVKDGKLKEFGMRYMTDLILDLEYRNEKSMVEYFNLKYGGDRGANPALLWDWKISEIIPNKDMREAFQLFCGSLLLDRDAVKVEYICYLVGPGSNGKSVAASAIEGVFGEEYFSNFTPRQLFKDSDARVNIAALQGKIANFVGDLEKSDISGGDFKRFVSGERFQGRRNFHDPIKVKAVPLLCCANEMPESSDDSHGHHRRQLPIYTTTRRWTEEDKDPHLTAKLTTHDARLCIFHWIYKGYKKIMQSGGNVVLGEDVKHAQMVLKEDSNSARRWWRDYLYKPAEGGLPWSDERWRSHADLYAEYCEYCDKNGYKHDVKKKNEIASMMRSQGFSESIGNVKRRSDGMYFCVDKNHFEDII